jgi:hypothetical protein
MSLRAASKRINLSNLSPSPGSIHKVRSTALFIILVLKSYRQNALEEVKDLVEVELLVAVPKVKRLDPVLVLG